MEFLKSDPSCITCRALCNKYNCDLCGPNHHNYCILPCCQKTLCSDCVDMLYDNSVPNTNSNILFKCLYCGHDVVDLQIEN